MAGVGGSPLPRRDDRLPRASGPGTLGRADPPGAESSGGRPRPARPPRGDPGRDGAEPARRDPGVRESRDARDGRMETSGRDAPVLVDDLGRSRASGGPGPRAGPHPPGRLPDGPRGPDQPLAPLLPPAGPRPGEPAPV